MKNFEYNQHEKAIVWLRHGFTVQADTREEADEFVRTEGLGASCDWHEDDKGGRVTFSGTEVLFETQSEITVEDNDGLPTIEIQAPDKRHVADNCGNRNYKAENNLWRDEAIELIKERFTAPDEKITGFVDAHWDNDAPDKDNLFNFDVWQHGGNPTRRCGKRELWAFLFPVDGMDRDASDARIVAAYESEENKDRDWPVEKLTLDELACKINDDQIFAEQYVRFITL